MDLIKKGGSMLGKIAGRTLGGTVRVVGELAKSEFIKEIGNGIESATSKTGELIGETASGIYDVGAGIITRDQQKIGEGLGDVGHVVGSTVIGIGQGICYVAESGKQVFEGVKEGDTDKLKTGTKNLVKVAAIGTIAIGIVDFLDVVDGTAAAQGSEISEPAISENNPTSHESFDSEAKDVRYIETIRDDLAGSVHPVTDVPYEEKMVQLPNGETIAGVFPDFEEVYAEELPEDMYLESDSIQFDYMNGLLLEEININLALEDSFTSEQLEQITIGETPDGYVWHHSEVPGRLELVDEQTHAQSGHDGGRSLWGGGADNR